MVDSRTKHSKNKTVRWAPNCPKMMTAIEKGFIAKRFNKISERVFHLWAMFEKWVGKTFLGSLRALSFASIVFQLQKVLEGSYIIA